MMKRTAAILALAAALSFGMATVPAMAAVSLCCGVLCGPANESLRIRCGREDDDDAVG